MNQVIIAFQESFGGNIQPYFLSQLSADTQTERCRVAVTDLRARRFRSNGNIIRKNTLHIQSRDFPEKSSLSHQVERRKRSRKTYPEFGVAKHDRRLENSLHIPEVESHIR
ncbi:hypothetical protein D3C86_1508490 [compost metagenome]